MTTQMQRQRLSLLWNKGEVDEPELIKNLKEIVKISLRKEISQHFSCIFFCSLSPETFSSSHLEMLYLLLALQSVLVGYRLLLILPLKSLLCTVMKLCICLLKYPVFLNITICPEDLYGLIVNASKTIYAFISLGPQLKVIFWGSQFKNFFFFRLDLGACAPEHKIFFFWIIFFG